MLSKNDVLSLRDFALLHLPKVRHMSERAYLEGHNSRDALQAVAWAPTGILYSPLSTVIERQAAKLLHWVGEHPDTHTEWLNDDMPEFDDFPGALTDALVADAVRDRSIIDEQLVLAAIELSRVSGAALPKPIAALSGPASMIDRPIAARKMSAPDEMPIRLTAPRQINKLRTNSLDAAIDKATVDAGSDDTAAVFLALRELALNGEVPFSGEVDGDALCYTNDKNQSDRFTKEALKGRLKRRKVRAARDGNGQ
jgi:hypothetical protein